MTLDVQDVFVAHTHSDWFDYLSRQAQGGRLDEVNFWSPMALKPVAKLDAGAPVFFRLGAPIRKIAGYGFFASFQALPLSLAWETFATRNGAPDRSTFYAMLGRRTPEDLARDVGCMMLLDAHFWPDPRWLDWGEERDYARTGNQRGKTERDPARVAMLLDEIRRDGVAPPDELRDDFDPLSVDEREVTLARHVQREGQGAFRLRLLQAYDYACAITGEHTEPVLDAAHIQRYLGPRSNHPANGIILTKEFHTLFDRGLITIEPPLAGREEYRIRVSKLIRERWNNGRRYNDFDGKALRVVPEDKRLLPSKRALEWHRAHVFERVA